MTPDQELEKRVVQGLADYKVLTCRYHQAVRVGFHNPEEVARRFDKYVQRYGMDAAEKKLTAKIFKFGTLRGHYLTKDGWTKGGIEREKAALEARSELVDLYQQLNDESKQIRATVEALEECRLRQLHQTWWQDLEPVNTEQPSQSDHSRLEREERARLDHDRSDVVSRQEISEHVWEAVRREEMVRERR